MLIGTIQNSLRCHATKVAPVDTNVADALMNAVIMMERFEKNS